MNKTLIAAAVMAVPLVALVPATPRLHAAGPQAQPRQQAPARGAAESSEAAGDRDQGRAQPRPQTPPPAPPRAGQGRRSIPAPPPRAGQGRRSIPAPPPRVVPPTYYRTPRTYYFPPVSVQRGFYYHPYFGFYFGPYYGPYYPYPGPTPGPVRYAAGALRTRVRPVETEVYVNGYYAGVADDFDGIFQRLYLPAGGHEIELRLDGYMSHVQKLYVQTGESYDITHQMQPAATDTGAVPLIPRALPPDWRDFSAPIAGDRPASPFGILALRVDPDGATILVDDEPWLDVEGLDELVLHVPAGWHAIEVRKEGYQTFRADVELSEGATTRLNLRLPAE